MQYVMEITGHFDSLYFPWEELLILHYTYKKEKWKREMLTESTIFMMMVYFYDDGIFSLALFFLCTNECEYEWEKWEYTEKRTLCTIMCLHALQ